MVVVLPLVPVTPIKAMAPLGRPQNSAANAPAHWATGSGSTKTASPAAGGLAAAAASPIRAAAAPAARAWGQKLPPSTWAPGNPTNRVPGPTRLESQVRLVISPLAKPAGTSNPTWARSGWSNGAMGGISQLAPF